MQTRLTPEFQALDDGRDAEAILRKCVHCGFCTATCPTYQLLGDELDGPRGRIYLIKEMLEGQTPTRATQLHLDRCLTCRNCETTCPSGVQYGRLVDIGRRLVDERVPRPAGERSMRWVLRKGVTSPLFAPAMALARQVRPLLPERLREKVPGPTDALRTPGAQRWPTRDHPRRVLLLMGCVQPAMAPNIHAATARVLDAIGVQTLVADEAGCCGAIDEHSGGHEAALAAMRRNIDAWWPHIVQQQVEAIIVNASGCAVTVKDYGHALRRDAAYAQKAERVSALARDLSEWAPAIAEGLAPRLKQAARRPAATGTLGAPAATGTLGAPAATGDGAEAPLAWHPPCTLQHGQAIRGVVERAFASLGMPLTMAAEAHLCCGSAGTYSILQPEIAHALRDRKLVQLHALPPDGTLREAPAAAGDRAAPPVPGSPAPAPTPAPRAILTANIGCMQHLQSGTRTPVLHWVEWIDHLLAQTPAASGAALPPR